MKRLRWLVAPVALVLLILGVLVGAGPKLRNAYAQAPLHQPLRIMAMGDSITQGFVSSSNDSPVGSWRHWFWQDRPSLGCGQIDMVGDRNTLFDGTTLPAGDDQDHQALAGYRMDQLYWDVNGGAVRRNLPDVVLLLAGTNDLFNWNTPYEPPAEVANDLDMVVTAARKDKPDIAFFVMTINPRNLPDLSSIVATNDLYRAYVAAHSTSQSPMFLVDGWNGFDGVKDTFDGVHPNLSGQHKISDRFHASLATYCSNSSTVTTTTTTTTTTTAPTTTTTTTRPTSTTTTTRPTSTTTTAPSTTTTTTGASKPTRYEAELAAVAAGVDTNDTMWCPCSGGRAVGGFRDPGQFVDWTVTVPKAGNYKLTWRYGAGGTSTNRELRVNGKTVKASLTFPTTNTWSNWQNLSVTVGLVAGANHVVLNSNTWVSADYLNLDYLDVG